MRNLTAKNLVFINEYLVDKEARAAGLRAGYSESYSSKICPMWVTPNRDKCPEKYQHIWDAARKALNDLLGDIKIEARYVLNRHVEIDKMDIGDILDDDMVVKPLHEWPKTWRTYLTSIEITELFEGSGDKKRVMGVVKKIKWPDKLKNLELLGKHIDVGAYSTKVEVNASEQFAEIIKKRIKK